MTRRTRLRAGGLIAGAALLAACQQSAEGDPMPQQSLPSNTTDSASSTTSTSVPGQLPHSGAPPVTDPLPASVLEGNPCGALTSANAKELLGSDYEQPRKDSTVLGPSCHWADLSTGTSFTVYYGTGFNAGLSQTYANVKPTAVRWVEMKPIEGYPVVGYLSAGSRATNTDCQVMVGISNKLAYGVGMTLSEGAAKDTDPCQAGRKVAVMVMDNLLEKVN